MKRKIFSILLALVLVVSFSLVMAVPVVAADRVILNQTRLAALGSATVEWETNPDYVYSGDYSAHGIVPSNADFFNIVHMDIGDGTPITLGEITSIQFMERMVSAGGASGLSAAVILFLNDPLTDPPVEGVASWWDGFDDGITFHNNGESAPVGEWSVRDLSDSAQNWEGYADSVGTGTVEPLSYWTDTWDRADWEVVFVSVAVGDGEWAGYEGYIDNVMVEWSGGVDTYLTEPRIVNTDQQMGYNYIQDAIDSANALDTISVAAGTYREYLHITTDGLIIEGAGIDESIIDLDGLIPYWHYGTNKSFSSRAGVLITGYLSTDEIIEGVTFSGFTVQNAGLNPPITATGTHDGADDAATLTDSSASWETDALVGQWLHNVSDKLIKIDISGNNPIRSYGLITANTATTVTATLAGGLDNDWDAGDTYEILPYEQYVDVAEDLQDDVPGIAISNGKDNSILYCKVINSGSVGISSGYARLVSTHKYSEGVTIDHCIVSDHPSRGISIGAYVGPITITNNICSNNGSPHPTDPSREYMGTGISVNGKKSSTVVSGGVISGNECHDNSYHGITLTGYVNGITVEDNIVTGSNLDEDGAGIFAEGGWGYPERCDGIIIRDNIVTGNIRGIIVYNAQNCTVGGDTAADGNTVTTNSGAFDSGQAAIKLDNAYNTVVKNNTVSCDGVGIRVTSCNSATLSHGNTIISNTITGAKFAGVRITKGAYDNTFEYNTITGTTSLTIAFQLPGEETQGDGVFIDDDAGTGNVFHNNNIYGNAGDGMENQVTTTTVDATNNWWGDISGPYQATTNPSGTGDPVSDDVHYSTWCAIEDLNLVTPGYQAPTPMVWGVSTDSTIQEAIDAALADDTINVAAGIYEEAISIKDKSLTLLGAQADVPIVNGERAGDESIIRGKVDSQNRPTTYCLVRIQHSDVVVNGFTIVNAKQWNIGIQGYPEAISNILISYNYTIEGKDGIFRDSAAADVTITHNYIASNSWRGILTNGGATTITDNTFYGNGQGIELSGGDPYDVYFPDYDEPNYPTIISGNSFTDDSTSITLRLDECHQSITVTGNDITEARSAAIRTRNTYDVDIVNPAINYNNIWNNEFGINNQVEELILDAKYNWWGGIGGPGGEGLGNGDNVTANVLYDPWLTKNQADTVSEGIAYFGSTISLEPGWNTLSVPLKLKDSANTMAEIMGLGDFLTNENVQIVYQYKSGSGWKNIGEGDTELVPLRGYYIKILGTDTVDFPVLYSGTLGLPTLDLSNGWNLIGSGFGIDKTGYGIATTDDVEDGRKGVATALYSIKDKCSVVVSPSTQGQVAAWGTTVIDIDKDMIVGEAYWVFMTTPVPTLAGFEVTPIYYLP